MDKLVALLKEFGLIAEKFYGVIEIKLEAGHIVLIRKIETIKPT